MTRTRFKESRTPFCEAKKKYAYSTSVSVVFLYARVVNQSRDCSSPKVVGGLYTSVNPTLCSALAPIRRSFRTLRGGRLAAIHSCAGLRLETLTFQELFC